MTRYQKIWGTAFVTVAVLIFGLLIYSGTTSENRVNILRIINDLDTTKVRNITIAPSNADWEINLSVDTLVVCDNNVIADIIRGLNGLTEKPLTKGAKRFWESYLIISFDQSYNANSKDKNKVVFKVYDTDEGLFLEMTNTMGYQTYSCQQLKVVLERLANYQKALGRQN